MVAIGLARGGDVFAALRAAKRRSDVLMRSDPLVELCAATGVALAEAQSRAARARDRVGRAAAARRAMAAAVPVLYLDRRRTLAAPAHLEQWLADPALRSLLHRGTAVQP